MSELQTLRRVHELRYKAHAYPLKPFPETEKELRAADHGLPHDNSAILRELARAAMGV